MLLVLPRPWPNFIKPVGTKNCYAREKNCRLPATFNKVYIVTTVAPLICCLDKKFVFNILVFKKKHGSNCRAITNLFAFIPLCHFGW